MKEGFAEYSLAELVADPLVRLLMESDGVDRRSIELLFEQLARAGGGELFNVLPKEATSCATF